MISLENGRLRVNYLLIEISTYYNKATFDLAASPHAAENTEEKDEGSNQDEC